MALSARGFFRGLRPRGYESRWRRCDGAGSSRRLCSPADVPPGATAPNFPAIKGKKIARGSRSTNSAKPRGLRPPLLLQNTAALRPCQLRIDQCHIHVLCIILFSQVRLPAHKSSSPSCSSDSELAALFPANHISASAQRHILSSSNASRCSAECEKPAALCRCPPKQLASIYARFHSISREKHTFSPLD